MEDKKNPRVLVLKSSSSTNIQEKINKAVEKGYTLEGAVQVITDGIEIQRGGIYHKYNNIYVATLNSHGFKIKD